MSKEIKIDGMPSIVKVEYHNKKLSTARINLDYSNQPITIDSLIEAMTILKQHGFEFSGRDYETGYYDSIEDITMEFTSRTFNPE